MSHFRNATFSGNIGTEPEAKTIAGNDAKEFVVYAQNRRKNKDTGEYESVGENQAVRVTLWRELAATDLQKGDLVEVVGSFAVRNFERQDGTSGYSLETDFVESVTVRYRKDGGASASSFGGNSPF